MNYVPGFSSYLETLAAGDALGGGYGLPTEQPVYAEPVVDYLNGWNYDDYQKQFMQGDRANADAASKWLIDQAAQGKEYVYDPGGNDLAYQLATNSAVPMSFAGPSYANFDPNNPAAGMGEVFRFDTGDKVGIPNAQGGFDYRNAAPTVFQPGQQYVMTDGSGKNVIGRASSPEEMQKLVDLSSDKKDWKLYQADAEGNYAPGTELFDRSNAGSFGSMILPMAALAGAGFGLGALGLGAGAGGAMPSIGTALADVGAQLAGTSVFGLPAAAGTAAAGGLGALAPAFGEIVVTGAPAAGVGALAPAFTAGTLGASLAAAQPGPVNYGDQVYDQPTDEIVVEGARPVTPPMTAPPLTLDQIMTLPAATTLAPNTSNITGPSTLEPTTSQAGPSTLSTLSKIADYMNLAGMGVGALGNLFGGGNASQGNRTISGGMGSLNPTFSAQLPGANIPGLGGAAGNAPRTAADLGQQGLSTPQDYYRYGYGPEQSFFNTVPQGAPNTSQAYTGYAEGGFAVTGPGDGREDKIPAMLSDGEYVMDAETVALLGNGSNKAGADMLDQFRVNVRKHKGRELARGGFSADAKRPDQYMAGGRA